MRFVIPPMYRPRHPLLRVAMALLGIAVFGALLVFGLLALGVLIAAGGVMMVIRAWRARHASGESGSSGDSGTSGVIEGEFVVVHERRHVPHH